MLARFLGVIKAAPPTVSRKCRGEGSGPFDMGLWRRKVALLVVVLMLVFTYYLEVTARRYFFVLQRNGRLGKWFLSILSFYQNVFNDRMSRIGN